VIGRAHVVVGTVALCFAVVAVDWDVDLDCDVGDEDPRVVDDPPTKPEEPDEPHAPAETDTARATPPSTLARTRNPGPPLRGAGSPSAEPARRQVNHHGERTDPSRDRSIRAHDVYPSRSAPECGDHQDERTCDEQGIARLPVPMGPKDPARHPEMVAQKDDVPPNRGSREPEIECMCLLGARRKSLDAEAVAPRIASTSTANRTKAPETRCIFVARSNGAIMSESIATTGSMKRGPHTLPPSQTCHFAKNRIRGTTSNRHNAPSARSRTLAVPTNTRTSPANPATVRSDQIVSSRADSGSSTSISGVSVAPNCETISGSMISTSYSRTSSITANYKPLYPAICIHKYYLDDAAAGAIGGASSNPSRPRIPRRE
jgi:hypothetical protein